MIFTLEAVQAEYGDCLILHYGETNKPSFILIDGGPNKDNWRGVVRKRLLQIKAPWAENESLPLNMVMVSHIDNDHIRGIDYLTQELVQCREDGEPEPFEILGLWHNSFDDIIGNKGVDPARLIPALPDRPDHPADKDLRAVVTAGVSEGRSLRDNAALLDLLINHPFEGLVRCSGNGLTVIQWDELELTVLHPETSRLQRLQKAWDEKLEEYRETGDESILVAAYEDESPFNLSSIVVLVRLGAHRMLLTGDARGDDIISGLRNAGLMSEEDGARFAVDILKLPHHGSHHNVTEQFFRQVPASHYMISGDGRYGNPEVDTLKMLTTARQDDDFTIYLTNEGGRENLKAKLEGFFNAPDQSNRNYTVKYRREDNHSIKCDLADVVDY